jgi:hypothetical protein
MNRERLRSIGLVAFRLGIAVLACWGCMFFYTLVRFLGSPMSPTPENKIVWDDHGAIHYITAFDWNVFRISIPVGVAGILICFVGLILLGRWRWPSF